MPVRHVRESVASRTSGVRRVGQDQRDIAQLGVARRLLGPEEMTARCSEQVPQPAASDFSAPHNWCDRRCERCFLSPECAVFRLTERARRNDIAAGRDPDSLDSIWSQVEQQLSATVEMLEDECRSRGIDPTTIEDWQRSAPCEELEDQASEYLMALLDLVETLRRNPRALASMNLSVDDLDEISGYGYVIAGKLGRVASYLTERGTLDGDVAAIDGAPNLLLLSLVLGELDELLPVHRLPRRPAAYLSAREDVRRQLEPLLATVPAACSTHLAQLVRLGRAPSPFCVATRGS